MRLMKRILVVTPGYYPAKTYGGPVVSISNLVEIFAGEIEFFIVTSNHELKQQKRLDGINEGWNKVGAAYVLYLDDNQMNEKRFVSICDEISPDGIYLNAIFHRLSTPKLLKIAKTKEIRCILAVRGGLCEQALRFSKVKKILYLQYLKMIMGKNVVFQSTSDEETKGIKKYIGKKAVIFELSNMPLIVDYKKLPLKYEKKKGSIRIIYVSRIHPIKNLDYAIDVLHNVKANVQFDIYGPKEDKQYWEMCQQKISSLPANISVRYCGFLEKEHRHDVFKDYDLFILPTQSENFGHAISEALSELCNVLISNNTPWTDVNQFKAGRAYDLNKKQQFIDYIEKIAMMSNEEIIENRSDIVYYLEEHFQYQKMKQEYLEMFSK